MSNIQCSLVPPKGIVFVGEKALKMLEKVHKYSEGRWNAEHLLDECRKDKAQLWIVFEGSIDNVLAFAVTRFMNYPNYRALEYTYVSGRDMKKWYDQLSELLHKFAKSAGCTRIETAGRKGWRGWHVKNGFRETHVVYDKVI